MKDERFRGQVPLEELQKNYFLYFNPNFWMHKANALLSFIEDPSSISKLRFEGDRHLEQTIIDSFKMELHMMVFHSAETLFLNVFSIVFMPSLPWVWTSRCDSRTLYGLINTVHEKGLSGIQDSRKINFKIKSSEVWLRENLYPSILDDKHPNYERSRLSAIFVKNYLQLLAKESLDHYEYNSNKHGLKSFVGKQRLQATVETTGQKIADMQTDFIQFLEFYKEDKNGKPFIDENKMPYTLVKLASKGFDYKRDYQLIMTNSAILYDLFYTKHVMLLTATEESRKFGYYFFDNFYASEMFHYDTSDKGTGILKRFTI